MFESWIEEPSPEETESKLRKCAFEIQKRKLELPAMLALESHAPIANTLGHLALGFAPFIAPIIGGELFGEYSSLLAKRANIERLICMLEESRASMDGEEEMKS